MNAKETLKKYAVRIAKQSWTAYEFAKEFGYDYSNTCKWYRDTSKLPISVAFQILDAHDAKLVVYRTK